MELPFAAHPTSVYATYDYDAEQIEHYVAATRTPESFRIYLDEYVYGVKDHGEYLEKIGGESRLNGLRADPTVGLLRRTMRYGPRLHTI